MATLQVAVRDLGPQFTSNTAGVLGHDCAYSIPLPDGRAIWLFGDTYMEDAKSTKPRERSLKNLICNCMAVVPRQDVSDGIKRFEYACGPDGKAKPVLELFPNEVGTLRRLWPMHGVALPEGEHGGCRIVIYYTMVDIDDRFPPPGNIKHLGTGIAVAHVAMAGAEIGRFDRLTSGGEPIFWSAKGPVIGSAVMPDRSERNRLWVYCMAPGDKHEVVVAQTSSDEITDPAKLRYWTGDSEEPFSADVTRAPKQFDGVPTEMSVGWSAALGKYLAVHTVLIFPDILARTADTPTGPWNKGETIFKAKPVTGKANTFYYAAKEHAELAADGGRTVFLTYVDSEEYWPRMLEVKVGQ
jgi:hypothetical protein